MYMGGDPYARPMSTFNGMGGGAIMPSMPYGVSPSRLLKSLFSVLTSLPF
jgi:hypothetical protein